MPYISQIQVPSGTTYDIKDAGAREILNTISGVTYFIGKQAATNTPITEGSTNTTVAVINGASTTAISVVSGNILLSNDGKKEFIYDGSAWREFGDLTSIKTSITYTPTGSVSSAFTGTNSTFTGAYTATGAVTLLTTATVLKVGTATNTVSTYVPSGEVTISLTKTANGSSKSVTYIYSAINSISSCAPASSGDQGIIYYSMNGECLKLHRIIPVASSVTNVSVRTGDATFGVASTSFSGAAQALYAQSFDLPVSATFQGKSATVAVSGKPAGNVSSTFNGVTTTLEVST